MGEVKLWHERDPGALQRLEHLVTAKFPTLHVVVADGVVHLLGTFPVRHGMVEIDRFAIDVALSSDHPRELPAIYETGGRIPRTVDRHMNGDGSACVVLPDAYWLENETEQVDVLQLLAREVHNYFLGQAAVEAGDPWPFGEWPHFGNALLELYGALFSTRDPLIVCSLLLRVVKPLKGHLPCPCGSGRRYRNCHRDVVFKIRERVPAAVLNEAMRLLLPLVSARHTPAGVRS